MTDDAAAPRLPDAKSWQALADLMHQVQEARVSLGVRPHQECFFRGHAQLDYKLVPSLYRRGDRGPEQYWKLERRMFFEFRTRARELYEADSDWDVLFHMQHHGVPTRLLDWTSVFGVALYFALNDRNCMSHTPCVWVLNPYGLNQATWGLARLFSPRYLARDEAINRTYDYGELLLGTHPIKWDLPLAIYSQQRSERMFVQSGWFTIHGGDSRCFEDMFAGRPGGLGSILRRVDISDVAIPAARQFLAAAGIGPRQLFPDLDGLSRSICEKFGLAR